MKPQFTTDVAFAKGNTTLFLLASKKQSVVQTRHRSIEKAFKALVGFGYLVVQKVQVKRGGGYQHLLIMKPWRDGVIPAEQYGQSGIRIGTTIVTQYDCIKPPFEFEPAHKDGRAALIYTPPQNDIKRQALAPVRYPWFAFRGMADGSIDFEYPAQSGGDELLSVDRSALKEKLRAVGAIHG